MGAKPLQQKVIYKVLCRVPPASVLVVLILRLPLRHHPRPRPAAMTGYAGFVEESDIIKEECQP